jgi:hypothetical protein
MGGLRDFGVLHVTGICDDYNVLNRKCILKLLTLALLGLALLQVF